MEYQKSIQLFTKKKSNNYYENVTNKKQTNTGGIQFEKEKIQIQKFIILTTTRRDAKVFKAAKKTNNIYFLAHLYNEV